MAITTHNTPTVAARAFRDYYWMIRERFLYLCTTALVCTLVAFVYSMVATKTYEGNASVRLLRENPKIINGQKDVISQDIHTAEDFNTQVQMLSSDNIITQVAQKMTPEVKAKFLAGYVGKAKGLEEDARIRSLLFANRRVEPVRLSLVIRLFVTHPEPEIAGLLPNMFVDEYIAQTRQGRNVELDRTLEELKAQANQQRILVEASEQKIQEFKEANKTVSLDERKDIITERLKSLNTMRTSIASELGSIEALHQQIQSYIKEGKSLLDITVIANDTNVKALADRVAIATIERARRNGVFRFKHPMLIEAETSLTHVKKELENACRAVASQIATQEKILSQRLADILRDLKDQESTSLNLDRLNMRYQTLIRESQINEASYHNILENMKIRTVAQGSDTQNVRIIDRSVTPNKPVSPKLFHNLLIGSVSGCVLGLALVIFLATIDDRVKSRVDVEYHLRTKLLAIVPHIQKLDDTEKAMLVLNNKEPEISESFKFAYAEYSMLPDNLKGKIILITGTQPSEGKSFCAANLAQTFAVHGQKTLLIDMDMRKPKVHQEFNVSNSKGMLQVLEGTNYLEVIQTSIHENLHIITSGGRTADAPERLNRFPVKDWFAELSKTYDKIIIDTPPVAVVSDALSILPFVNGVIFVIRYNTTAKKAVEVALKKVGVPVIGAILNDIRTDMSEYYYGYNYQYYARYYPGKE